MQRLKNLGKWIACLISGIFVFVAIMVIAFCDTVILGRSFDQQLGEKE